jgi:hypothetical protein
VAKAATRSATSVGSGRSVSAHSSMLCTPRGAELQIASRECERELVRGHGDVFREIDCVAGDGGEQRFEQHALHIRQARDGRGGQRDSARRYGDFVRVRRHQENLIGRRKLNRHASAKRIARCRRRDRRASHDHAEQYATRGCI